MTRRRGPATSSRARGPATPSHAEIVVGAAQPVRARARGCRAEQAAYATVAAIALHGVRLCGLGLGDVAAVVGLGLVGQITLELLRAAGCVALGLDPDPARVELARAAGFFAHGRPGRARSGGGATHRAPRRRRRPRDGGEQQRRRRWRPPIAVARERATVCVVGDVAIESPRTPLFAKELRLVVSRSYGPGRYDPVYEEQRHRLPGRLRALDRGPQPRGGAAPDGGRHRCAPSASRRTASRSTTPSSAYDLLGDREPSLGIVLEYPATDAARRARSVPRRRRGEAARAASRRARGSASSARAPSPAPCCCLTSPSTPRSRPSSTATGPRAARRRSASARRVAGTDAGARARVR